MLLLRLSSSVAMSPLRGVWGGRRGRGEAPPAAPRAPPEQSARGWRRGGRRRKRAGQRAPAWRVRLVVVGAHSRLCTHASTCSASSARGGGGGSQRRRAPCGLLVCAGGIGSRRAATAGRGSAGAGGRAVPWLLVLQVWDVHLMACRGWGRRQGRVGGGWAAAAAALAAAAAALAAAAAGLQRHTHTHTGAPPHPHARWRCRPQQHRCCCLGPHSSAGASGISPLRSVPPPAPRRCHTLHWVGG